MAAGASDAGLAAATASAGASRTARRAPALHSALLALTGIAEAIAFFLVARNSDHVLLLGGAYHAMFLALTVSIIVRARRRREDITFLLLGLLAGIAIGPPGFLGASLLPWLGASGAPTSPLVTQWYDRIALSTSVPAEERLFDDVAVGRTLDLDAPAPLSFPATMTMGPLADRQAILGQIARHFEIAYLPTLKLALASPDAGVRVQAAAVASHVGPAMRRTFRELSERASRAPSDPIEALSLLDQLSLVIRSGLLDASERQLADALARRLGDTVVGALGRGPLKIDGGLDTVDDMRLTRRLEELLVERRRFAELRLQRTADSVRARHPSARLRRLVPSVHAREGSA